MKQFFLSVTVIASLFSITSFSADRPSVGNYPELSRLIGLMTESAANGASLEFFGYSENTAVTEMARSGSCKELNSREVARAFAGAVRTAFENGSGHGLSKGEYAKLRLVALAQFRDLIGSESYVACSRTENHFMSVGKITAYFGTNYRFAFEFGYED
jgi:hypothetical protein